MRDGDEKIEDAGYDWQVETDLSVYLKSGEIISVTLCKLPDFFPEISGTLSTELIRANPGDFRDGDRFTVDNSEAVRDNIVLLKYNGDSFSTHEESPWNTLKTSLDYANGADASAAIFAFSESTLYLDDPNRYILSCAGFIDNMQWEIEAIGSTYGALNMPAYMIGKVSKFDQIAEQVQSSQVCGATIHDEYPLPLPPASCDGIDFSDEDEQSSGTEENNSTNETVNEENNTAEEESCTDSDNDGVCDDSDTCAGHDDGKDQDGDGIPDGCDNCPAESNSEQNDADGDGEGDACEQDGPD
jgi:hypothetical protein